MLHSNHLYLWTVSTLQGTKGGSFAPPSPPNPPLFRLALPCSMSVHYLEILNLAMQAKILMHKCL